MKTVCSKPDEPTRDQMARDSFAVVADIPAILAVGGILLCLGTLGVLVFLISRGD